MNEFELAIVGGGLASARAIRSYREAGGEGRIVLISRDSVLPYHRPPLSKRFLRGEAEAMDALVEQEAFYSENDVELLLATAVQTVDVKEKRLELGHREPLRYNRLLLATGATPNRLEVPGASLGNVFRLRSLDDSAAIREAAINVREAVVVGGGFIGVEVAASLRHVGLELGRRRIEHWSNANYQGTEVGKILAGEDGGYDIVSSFFTEFFGLTMKVFGDIEEADDLIIRGSLSDRDLIGFYLQEGALVATAVVGQEDETEEKLKELIRAKAVATDKETLADTSVSVSDAF